MPEFGFTSVAAAVTVVGVPTIAHDGQISRVKRNKPKVYQVKNEMSAVAKLEMSITEQNLPPPATVSQAETFIKQSFYNITSSPAAVNSSKMGSVNNRYEHSVEERSSIRRA